MRAVAEVAPDHDSWTDVTVVPGLRPRMRTTISEPSYRWAEEGEFGPFGARLELRFRPTAEDACLVVADFAVRGLGLGRVLTLAAGPAVAADLRRAASALRG